LLRQGTDRHGLCRDTPDGAATRNPRHRDARAGSDCGRTTTRCISNLRAAWGLPSLRLMAASGQPAGITRFGCLKPNRRPPETERSRSKLVWQEDAAD